MVYDGNRDLVSGYGNREIVRANSTNFNETLEISTKGHLKSNTSISTGVQERALAIEEKIGQELHDKAVRAEMRSRLLVTMGKKGVGTNRMEFNQKKQRGELSRDPGRIVSEIVVEMERKAVDAKIDANEKRRKDVGMEEVC